jgi:molecular chaperone HtpG
MMTDDKFREKAEKFHIMQDAAAHDTFYTLGEYRIAAESLQKNKEGKLVILYTTDPVQQDAYIKAATSRGYKVVKMETLVDASFINQMESRWDDVRFTRVDSDITDNLIDPSDLKDSVLSEEESEKLKTLFSVTPGGLQLTVEVKGLSPESAPVMATRPEFMRRMKDMGAVSGPMGAFYANMPDEVTLTVNGNHPVCKQILSMEDEAVRDSQVHNLADLALLSQGLLKGADLTAFIERSMSMLAPVK